MSAVRNKHVCYMFEVRAHKLILAGVSPVFRKMFYSSATSETQFTMEKEDIEITDSECFAFQNMITFIYSKVMQL